MFDVMMMIKIDCRDYHRIIDTKKCSPGPNARKYGHILSAINLCRVLDDDDLSKWGLNFANPLP